MENDFVMNDDHHPALLTVILPVLGMFPTFHS
jgi:hypothetical protein